MFVVKGFAPHAAFFNNNEHAVNEVGEISTLALTFARDKGVYSNKSISESVSLITFLCQQDNVVAPLTPEVRDHALAVLSYIYDYTISKPGIEVDHTEILNALLDQFVSTAQNFNGGLIVNDGTYYVPSFVSWEMKDGSAQFMVWLSDDEFRKQYPEYLNIVVSPIWEPLAPYPADGFFRPGTEVQQLLEAVTMTEMASRLQEAKEGYPETFIRIDSFDYHDPNNINRVVPSPFGLLIHGNAGNNIDSIKDALQSFLLSHSNHPREDWIEILPDIFKRTEIVFVPAWNQMAIPDQTAKPGIYSSVMKAVDVPALLKSVVTDYPSGHVDLNAMVTGWPWKSLAVCSIGNIENRDAKYLITDLYPDWISVSSTSTDFNRMSLRTRQWFEKIHEMIYAAESFKEYDNPPTGVAKIVRDGKIFLSRSIENIHYLVLCKISLVV